MLFWERIYQQNAPRLLVLCRRYVRDPQKAQDILHDAFVNALSKQHSFQGIGSLEGWLSKITLNTVLMHLRQDKTLHKMLHPIEQDVAEEVEIDLNDGTMTPQQFVQSVDFDADTLLEIVNLLPDHHRTVFNLYVFEDYSHQQIAHTLNISIGTSKSHLARARKKLQFLLIQKAQSTLMPPQKRRQRAFFWLWFNQDLSYLDRLFKNKLSNQPIQPPPIPPHLKQLFENTPPIQSHISLKSLQKIGFFLMFCLGLGMLCWQWREKPTPFLIESDDSNKTLSIQNRNLQNIDNQGFINEPSVSKPIVLSENPTIQTMNPSPFINGKQQRRQTQVPANQRIEKKILKQSILQPSTSLFVDSVETVIIKKQIIVHDTIYHEDDF
jgi:RNA polymerase sigma factor (sigma-70 family)